MSFILSHWQTVVIMILLGAGIVLYKNNKELQIKVKDKDITINSMAQGIQQYKAKDGTYNARLINERRTKQELLQSKDSIIIKMRAQVANANIKMSNALALGYMKTKIQVDTLIKYIPKHDSSNTTLAKLDTILDFSKPPYIVNTVTLTDSTAKNTLIVKNEVYPIVHAEKQFVEPRKSFFLFRWFQKRQWTILTDIHNSNPFIETEESKFITVVDSDGGTKTEEAK